MAKVVNISARKSQGAANEDVRLVPAGYIRETMRKLEIYSAALSNENALIGTAVAMELDRIRNDLDCAAEILERNSAE